jgi:cytosine/adenosine deaminase-related metal-dependent hydrolase
LKGTSFGEVLGMAGRSDQFDGLFQQAVDQSMQREGLRSGIEPHAPYSLSIGGYRRSVDYAREHGLPICTHLAETPDEAEFLAQHTGPFRRLWEEIGGWTEGVETFDGGPIRFAESAGLLDITPVLAHCNYIDNEELELLSRKPVSVVYCPRTHAYFAHRPHRFREMMARGINVAIGTDSAMSAGDLNLLEDLRLVHRIAPEMNPLEIWKMATINAARALGMESSVGTIEPGKSADFLMFSAATEDPLAEVLQGQSNATGVWIDGVKN